LFAQRGFTQSHGTGGSYVDTDRSTWTRCARGRCAVAADRVCRGAKGWSLHAVRMRQEKWRGPPVYEEAEVQEGRVQNLVEQRGCGREERIQWRERCQRRRGR